MLLLHTPIAPRLMKLFTVGGQFFVGVLFSCAQLLPSCDMVVMVHSRTGKMWDYTTFSE